MPEEHVEDDRFKKSKAVIENDPQHTFHKMALFPAISSWINTCNLLIKQQGVDANREAFLPSVRDLCKILLQQEEIVKCTAGHMMITEATKYQGLFSKVAQIKAGASERFLAEKCASTFESVNEVQAKLKEAVFSSIGNNTIETVCGALKALFTSTAKALPPAKVKALKAGLENLQAPATPSAEKLGLNLMLPKEDVDAYTMKAGNVKKMATTVKEGFPILLAHLQKQSVDLNQSNIINLFGLCYKPELVEGSDALKGLVPQIKESILKMIFNQMADKVEQRAAAVEKVTAATTDEAMLDAMKALMAEGSSGNVLSYADMDFFNTLRQSYFKLDPTVINLSICGKNVDLQLCLALPIFVYLADTTVAIAKLVADDSDLGLADLLKVSALENELGSVNATHEAASRFVTPETCPEGALVTAKIEIAVNTATSCVHKYMQTLSSKWQAAVQANRQ